VVCMGLIFWIGCSAPQTQITSAPASLAIQPTKSAKYIIQPGDELDVKFFYNPELNESIKVRPDGKISLQLVDDVQAEGLAPAELDQKLTDLYSKELKKPVVTVIVKTFSAQKIYVGGEVGRQGLLNLSPGTNALQAVFEAGGFLDSAMPAETLVIRKGEDNRPIPVKINLENALQNQGDDSNIALMANDVIYVPKSPIAKANLFVNQYIERLLLFRGVSFGFTYDVSR